MSFYDISVGSGFQVVTVDLTGSDNDLLASMRRVKARVYHDDSGDIESSYEAEVPVLAAAPALKDGEAQLYTVTKSSLLGSYTATIFRICHTFKRRGLYLISLSVEDTDGRETSSPVSIRVGVGDGLPKEIS